MGSDSNKRSTFHAVMFPWFAMGHLTPYLHLSNKLAEKGNRITFLVPTKTMSKLESLNLHPNLISFIPLNIPHVDGLPLGAETTNNVPASMEYLLHVAMDMLQDHVKALLQDLKPDYVLYDRAHWIPEFTRPLGIKSIMHLIVGAGGIAYFLVPSRMRSPDIMKPPVGFPASSPLKLHRHELHAMSTSDLKNSAEDFKRCMTTLKQCDIISCRTYREIEGHYCDYIASQYGKTELLLTGPTLPPPSAQPLEEEWKNWLGKFKAGSVLYCAFGSECIMKKDQFQELVLGLELTGNPFLVALKPPQGCSTIDEALPEGFKERVKERGIVHGGWVQQPQILAHPSVGCFISHCGYGSFWESLLVNDFQIVLVPNFPDQYICSRLLSEELKVAVEVKKRDEDGWYSKENVCSAVKSVMDEGSQIGAELKANHSKWRKLLSDPELESSYIDNFTTKLLDLLM